MAAPQEKLQMGICQGTCENKFPVEALKKNGGMCKKCCISLMYVSPPILCKRCDEIFDVKNGFCKFCHQYNEMVEKVKRLEKDNAQLKQDYNNTIAAYVSFVEETQKDRAIYRILKKNNKILI